MGEGGTTFCLSFLACRLPPCLKTLYSVRWQQWAGLKKLRQVILISVWRGDHKEIQTCGKELGKGSQKIAVVNYFCCQEKYTEALFLYCKELKSDFIFKLLWDEAFCRGTRTGWGGGKSGKQVAHRYHYLSHSFQNQFCHVGSRLFSVFFFFAWRVEIKEWDPRRKGRQKAGGGGKGVRRSLCFWNKMSNGMFTFQTATGQCPFPSLICGDQLFGQGCRNPSGRALHFKSQSEDWKQTQLKEESTLPTLCKASSTLPLGRMSGHWILLLA